MSQSPHDVPTAAQLIESVREWLQNDVLAATSGRIQFHSRVAINVLAMVERELATLGFASDRELAAAIREGSIDDRIEDVVAAVWSSVLAKVEVANPSYLVD
jgi:hypothetical protein